VLAVVGDAATSSFRPRSADDGRAVEEPADRRPLTRATPGDRAVGIGDGTVGRIPPAFFGMALGLAGLAALWLYGSDAFDAPAAVGDLLMLLAAATWVVVTTAYLRQGVRQILADARDAAVGPFLAAPVMTALVLGAALSSQAPAAGRVVIVIALVAGVLVFGWLTGQWLTRGVEEKSFGPAFYLPGGGIGWVGAEAASTVGLHSTAAAFFGMGAVSWVFISSILLKRMRVRRRLSPALIPTLALGLAPPVVAGNAYFVIHPGSPDKLAFGLAGYAAVMAAAQVRLFPLYRALSFTASFWAFTFPSAALATLALRWLALEHPVGAEVCAWILIAAVTVLVGLMAARTIVAGARGDLVDGRRRVGAGRGAEGRA
jgi:tellurite resistance protein